MFNQPTHVTRVYKNGVCVPINHALIHLNISEHRTSDLDILTGFMKPIASAIRASSDHSKTRLAKRLGMSRQSVWRKENYYRELQLKTPLVDNLRIAAALGFVLLVTPRGSVIRIDDIL